MITSPAAISFGIWLSPPRHRLSFNLGFPASLTSSASTNHFHHFPLISTLSPIQKDVGRSNFQAFEFCILGRVSAHPVTTKVESDCEVHALAQSLKSTDALPPTLKDVIISDPEASSGAKTSKKERNPKRLSSSAAQIKKLDHFPVIRYPLSTESAIKAMMECNTLVFVVDKHADKKNIKDTIMKTFKIRAKKVNTLMMPDGTKKAYIMLAPEFNAVDVAKKIKIL